MDGLSKEWKDEIIWLNPPFSNKEKWLAKARDAVDNHNCKVMLLLPVSLETEVFRKYILGKAIIHIPNKRVKFIDEQGNNGKSPAFTSALFELTKQPTAEYKLFKI